MRLRQTSQGRRYARCAGRSARAVDRLRQGRGACELDLGVGQADHLDLCGAGHLVWRCVDLRRGSPHTRLLCTWRDTTLNVAKADFKKILTQHVEFYDAMLRLHARRIRQLYGLVEDLNTLPLRARLAKQLNHLLRSYGVPSLSDAKAIRISLQLAQEELAQLLGASRQRVNQELKQMEREQIIRIEPGGLVVLDRDALLLIVNADH